MIPNVRLLVPSLLLLASCARPAEADAPPPVPVETTLEGTVEGTTGLTATFTIGGSSALDPRVSDPRFAPTLAALAHPLARMERQYQSLADHGAAERRWAAFAGPGAARSFPFPPSPLTVHLAITNTTDHDVVLADPRGDDSRWFVAVDEGAYIGVLGSTDATLRFFSGEPVTLAPGATLDVEQSTLTFGSRDARFGVYFTRSGAATVELAFATTLSEGGGAPRPVVFRSGRADVEVTN